MQRITKERSGYHIIWPLADALKWRCSEFDRSIDEAFGELAQLCGDGRIKAVGIFTGSHPTRPMDWPKHDIWQGPPTSHPINTPMLGDIPAAEWADLLYVLDENQRSTSSLKYASVRLPAWKGVEFDRDPLVELWLLIPSQYKEEAAQNIPKQEIAPLSGGACSIRIRNVALAEGPGETDIMVGGFDGAATNIDEGLRQSLPNRATESCAAEPPCEDVRGS